MPRLTREQREARRDARQSRRSGARSARQERRDERRDQRQEHRTERQESREGRREQRQERRDERRGLRQEQSEARQDRPDSRDERREERRGRRDERRDQRQEHRQERQQGRDGRREDRQERRAERQDQRQEHRAERQEGREERREDRQEFREWRRETRDERRVQRSERALVVYSEFNEDGDTGIYRQLYTFVERSGISVAMTLLQGSYDRLIPVTGPASTLDQFIESIELALLDPDIEEVDVIFNSHGSYNIDNDTTKVYFAPDPSYPAGTEERSGAVNIQTIGARIEELDAEDRLRMFYTTACWGGNFAEEMVASGFSCGAGAIDINTNSALEYPAFLTQWKLGVPFGTALRMAEKRSAYRATDAAARLMDSSFSTADSRKRFSGDTSVNKRTNADF